MSPLRSEAPSPSGGYQRPVVTIRSEFSSDSCGWYFVLVAALAPPNRTSLSPRQRASFAPCTACLDAPHPAALVTPASTTMETRFGMARSYRDAHALASAPARDDSLASCRS